MMPMAMMMMSMMNHDDGDESLKIVGRLHMGARPNLNVHVGTPTVQIAQGHACAVILLMVQCFVSHVAQGRLSSVAVQL